MSIIQRVRPHIHIVILCLCWYTISSIGSRVTKKILTECPLPLFLGEFQFIYTAFLALGSCALARKYRGVYNTFPAGTFPNYYRHSNEKFNHSTGPELDKQDALIISPSKHIINTVLPLGLFQFVGKYFGHTATSLVPVSTVASIKTLSPVFILIFQKCLRISTLPLSLNLWLSLFSIVAGVWIIVNEDGKNRKSKLNSKDGSYSSSGILCAIISMFIFVAQNIHGKKIFTFKSDSKLISERVHNSKESTPLPFYNNEKVGIKYDKLTLMIYISSVGFCLSLGWFSFLEFPIVWNYVFGNGQSDVINSIPWKLFLVNGTFHFIQAMIAFHLLGEVSTLTYSIANLMKRIAIISVSWIFSGVSVSFIQVFGLLLNALGLFLYEQCNNKNKLKKLRPE
ncbi:similar to Saccharomyces cerevisiae YJL193W Putative protein of unknown function, predicted to encode a triose phosphate transporter subfamily member based on phylogenetic analysis [Maudiozyma barnettii]|uniref:Sugar phosphate transporter domain-containing protein n=1 Tax=Maudiozyma barnettii TaxID=61262 RepID=A0A8H2VGA2_9SACH|nr:hypothetical protein [Kazachstania barnettii]CAB4254698.1 similar to Saccharomyces cerevisiae YJL193W Putative protein of unknown function, predicted to encode a triose phosphate transporter subfamily member based on phylogenetic analysis [Kazachstania barnettii]CAD1782740.1 similar to Saccharomyces cerevisiae YJL193W Putative protein of unknown function, predicted to encode a triose phosphate transporter subfamily member based on phylogenetic analysis [Kazachstania barnettii]